MTCNKDINLDEDTLFQYVLEQDQIGRLIDSVGPSDQNNFGKATEPFLMDKFKKPNENKSSYTSMLCIVIFVVILLVIMFSISSKSCGLFSKKLDTNSLELMSPVIGPEVRAIFSRS